MLITSVDNKSVRLAASLAEKKYRDKEGAYLLEGPNLIREALQYGGRLRFIFTQASHSTEELSKLTEAIKDEGLAIYETTDEILSKIAQTKTPQGIIAVAEKNSFSEEEFFKAVKGKNLLVLDRIQDPGNVGTLFRTAEAAGFGGIILIKGSQDPYAPKVVRAAAGSVQRLPHIAAETGILKKLKAEGYRIFAADMGGESQFNIDLTVKSAVVIGNEGNGISDEISEAADQIISIPMLGRIESLNAGLAGGIIMYEVLRQQLKEN